MYQPSIRALAKLGASNAEVLGFISSYLASAKCKNDENENHE